MYVPSSCCVLIYEQDRDVSRVDPKVAEPRDLGRCQRDAHGNIPTEFLHGYVSKWSQSGGGGRLL